MSKYRFVYWFLLPLLSSCIGTDILEQEFVDPEIRITNEIMSIKVGEQATFEAAFFDRLGQLDTTGFLWTSSDPEIISINDEGIASAHSGGIVIIEVTKGGISDTTSVEAGEETIEVAQTREGTFRGLSNYSVSGGFSISEDQGMTKLTFKDDFSTSSGPGLYVYLSNSPTSVQGGVEVGKLKDSRGAQDYDLPEGVEVSTYDHVIIYCKPFGLPFGTGEFQ